MAISCINKCKKGFTLIELVVVVGLLVLIMSTVIIFIKPMRNMFASNTALVSYKEESKVVLDLIEQRLKNAEYIAIYDLIFDVDGKPTLPTEPADKEGKEKNYLFVNNGVIFYQKKKSTTYLPFIDEKVFNGNQVFVHFSVPRLVNDASKPPNKCLMQVELQILNDYNEVLYRASTAFELVNMKNVEARLYDLSDEEYDYEQIIVFIE